MAYKAFLVGINTQGLLYCENDVQKLSQSLQNCNYEIYIPTNKFQSSINDKFNEFIDSCNQTDTLVVYFSGHAVIDRGKLHLLLEDDSSKRANLLNLNEKIDEFGSSRATNKLVILDCCHASMASTEWNLDFSDKYFILTASDKMEKSKEVDKYKNSFLAYKICQYINETEQRLDTGGEILLKDLYTWLIDEAKNENTRANKISIPNLLGNEKFIFSMGLKNSAEIISQEEIKQLILAVRSKITHSSTPTVSSLSNNPKPLGSIFVDPILCLDSEYKHNPKRHISPLLDKNKTEKEEEKIINLSEVIETNKNFLIIGRKETGKTTLLQYICNFYLQETSLESRKVPVIIDFLKLPHGNNRLEEAIRKNVETMGIDAKTARSHLVNGNFVVLLDNIDFEPNKSKVLKDLVCSIQKFNKNRFIFTTSENAMDELEFKDPPFLGADFEVVYLHYFKRKQIKSLIEKWFDEDSDSEEIVKRVIKSLDELRLPSTPLSISLLLIATEHQPNEIFVPINKSALWECAEKWTQKMS